MASKGLHLVFLVFIVASCYVCTADEACYSYASGQVYPGESRNAAGHTMHYSKALSKLQHMISVKLPDRPCARCLWLQSVTQPLSWRYHSWMGTGPGQTGNCHVALNRLTLN